MLEMMIAILPCVPLYDIFCRTNLAISDFFAYYIYVLGKRLQMYMDECMGGGFEKFSHTLEKY